MNSSAISMELSVSFVSWINDQLRDQLAVRQVHEQSARRENLMRGVLATSAATVSLLVCVLIAL